MNTPPPFFLMNPQAHFMPPGAVAFIPGWIWLFIIILTLAMLFPKLFIPNKVAQKTIVNPYLLSFIIGSLMPIGDDLLAFLLGPPLAHHSLFHSLSGSLVTLVIFKIISTSQIAKYAFYGNLFHIFFNYYFDFVTLLFPFTYQEFGLTDIVKIHTYWIKTISYPAILLLFGLAILKFFIRYRIPKK